MPNYRRFYFPGGTYFFTIVTCNRYPFFNGPIARRILLASYRLVEHEMPFKLFAWAVMPEHLHAVVTLPRGDYDFSTRIKKLKKLFSESWLASVGHEEPISESRKGKKNGGFGSVDIMSTSSKTKSILRTMLTTFISIQSSMSLSKARRSGGEPRFADSLRQANTQLIGVAKSLKT